MNRATKRTAVHSHEVDASQARVLGRGLRAGKAAPRLPLRAVREAMHKTQVELAAALGLEQGDVSRVERREDVKLSTLRRYAEALGAQCEVVFVFPKTGHRITIADPE
jgi:DNA-binding XRE family transcriptional regulator